MSNPDDSTAAPYDLLAATHDLTPGRGPTNRSYLVCSTPRSGSTLLAEAMHRTGEFGIPAEYLDIGAALPYLYQRWGCNGFEDYVRSLHEHRTADNGLFGVKAHWHQLLQFANMSQGAEPLAEIEFDVLVGVLRRVTPRPSFLFITRQDKERQAVSHWVASKTQRWINLTDEPITEVPEYSFAEIAEYTKGIIASEQAWERFFSMANVAPLRIVYEEFVADYESTVRRTATYLGLDPESLDISPPRMRRQSNDVSRAYAERYRADRQKAGV